MDYILKKIDKKIHFFKAREDILNLKIYQQVKFEYQLLFLLSYLWNKNFLKLDISIRESIFEKITEPSIGDIVYINRRLDIDGEVFKSKKTSKIINNYPAYRNEKIGHGYLFEDNNSKFIDDLHEMNTDLTDNISILKENNCFVFIESNINGILNGIIYYENGEYDSWMKPDKDSNLDTQTLYIIGEDKKYYKMSPFILFDSEDEIYTFRCIEEVLLGKFKYNRLFITGTIQQEWKFFKDLNAKYDTFKKVSANGTIINIFNNNYNEYRYIENRGIEKKLDDFIKSESFVCATLWGHGGVGKTAAVQNFCDKLQVAEKRKFDYILFVSAKDRYFDYHTGKIKPISGETSYSTIIKNLNKLICNNDICDENNVIQSDARFLLIIDDFETFSKEDKEKIELLVKKLSIYKHKVIITTRSNSIIGDEIKTNELDKDCTSYFLKEIFKEIFHKDITNQLTECINEKIHNITSGRPIFILQFAYILAERGLNYSVGIDLKNSKQAIEFLYGKIYEYLNPLAQKIFVVMGIVADSEDMTNLIDKIKYILNMENEAKFDECITDIEKLRLVEILDNKFYKIYSKEILEIMKQYFEKFDDNFKITTRKRILQVSKDKYLDNDNALLSNANAARYSQTELEVVSLYQQILNRKSCKNEIKSTALLNVAEYLFNDRGNKNMAIDKLEKYYVDFKDDINYIKNYSNYLWACLNKEKAVNLLLNFFSIKRNTADNDVLELFGTLVTYRSLYWIELREETKEGYKYGDIIEEDYHAQLKEQRDNFKDISKKQGNLLLEIITKRDFAKMSSGARQSLITASYQYVEICIRINDWDTGNHLCTFVSEKLVKYNYGLDFDNKKNRIKMYRKNNMKVCS
ncbi:MAG: NB-ARC domain-containing protein [Mobilitalea sp.]